MSKEYKFSWAMHLTECGRRKNLPKTSFSGNGKLPVEYWCNPDYDLTLTINGNGKKDIKYKFKSTDENSKNNRVKQVFAIDYISFGTGSVISSLLNKAVNDWRDISNLIYLPIVLGVFISIGFYAEHDLLIKAVSVLLEQNASKVTVILGYFFLFLLSSLHVAIPFGWVCLRRISLFTCKLFFGLIIGAASFCFTSYTVGLYLNVDTPVNGLEVSFAIFICIFAHLYNNFLCVLDWSLNLKGRFIYFLFVFLAFTFLYVFKYIFYLSGWLYSVLY